MATRNSKAASPTNARRAGRPTNAERNARVQSQQVLLIDTAMAAASAAVKATLGIIDGGVSTIGIPQGSQFDTASTSTSTSAQPAATKTATRRQKQAPGRRVDEDSAMSKTRRFYDENLNSQNPLIRADFVREAAKRFGYTPQTANTYVSNIEKASGYKLVRRGGAGAARGRSRGNGNGDTAKKTATA